MRPYIAVRFIAAILSVLFTVAAPGQSDTTVFYQPNANGGPFVYYQSQSGAALYTIPEPTTLAMLALSGPAVFRRRRLQQNP